ncbi:MAG: VanZ family protein [Candidatus Portnoybacteria bacterium]|nr:VanZ family protein [Candidatus Portnoybacteria bacterium]
MTKFIKYWLPVILWAGLIFYLSNRSGLKSGFSWPYDFVLRKGAHMVEFAILFLLILRALENYSVAIKKALLWAFLLTLLYAVSDEFHQSFISERVGVLTDVMIDSFGALLITWWKIRRSS